MPPVKRAPSYGALSCRHGDPLITFANCIKKTGRPKIRSRRIKIMPDPSVPYPVNVAWYLGLADLRNRVEAKFLLSDFQQIAEKDIGTLKVSSRFRWLWVVRSRRWILSPVVHVELRIMIGNRIVNLGATTHVRMGSPDRVQSDNPRQSLRGWPQRSAQPSSCRFL